MLLLMLSAGIASVIAYEAPAQQPTSPIVPGLHGNHPLSQRQVGELLIDELNCAACHSSISVAGRQAKSAPDLKDVGSRVSPQYLQQFLANPAQAHPGTTMPQVMTGADATRRAQIALELTHYLTAAAASPFQPEAGTAEDQDLGRKLFHSVGCVACHPPREATVQGMTLPDRTEEAVSLKHLSFKYSRSSLAKFLHQPLAVRPSGRMPDMGLKSTEAEAIAGYLLGLDAPDLAPWEVDPAIAKAGEAQFQQLGCISCHEMDGMSAPAAVDAPNRSLDPESGCLSSTPNSAPDFNLSEAQRSAIGEALLAPATEASIEQDVAMTLTRFNCIACHVRGDYGGVDDELNLFFETSEPSLGNDARIPPPLTHAGAKLKPEWMEKVMFDGASVRPYMHTRMPQYGEANLSEISSLLQLANPAVAVEMPVPKGEESKTAREAARTLLGADMLGCINCHAFNDKKSPAFNGIDLITVVERLQPDWFMRFLIAPQEHRPGIVMPQSWPGGVAVRTDILEGNTDAQLKAIWHFLSQGRSARDPKGIRSEATVLEVTDTPRTYRGRSRIAGFRGIAVGFPDGVNYAFNANHGTLSGIWKGGFVRVRWDGQGAGDFNPADRAITLAQDVGLCELADDTAPWPLQPVMTEEKPVNPDPLYPRYLGYQFGGYSFDEQSVPTFHYKLGDVAVDDTTVSGGLADTPSLVRVLKFNSPTAKTLYFRVLTGEIKTLDANRFQADGLRVQVPLTKPKLRPLAGVDGPNELILKLELPQGASTQVIRYEVL